MAFVRARPRLLTKKSSGHWILRYTRRCKPVGCQTLFNVVNWTVKPKWAVTIMAAVVLVAASLTAGIWLPHLGHFARINDKKIEALQHLVELVGTLLGAAIVVVKWLLGKKDKAPNEAKNQDVRCWAARGRIWRLDPETGACDVCGVRGLITCYPCG